MKAASSNESIEDNSVRKFEDLWGDHPCDHICNEDPAIMITYPCLGLDRHREVRVDVSKIRKVVEVECCSLNHERECNKVIAIMKANPYVGALLLSYISQLGHQADPDDASSACATILPRHWLEPSGGSDRQVLFTVPFEEDPETTRKRMADIRRNR